MSSAPQAHYQHNSETSARDGGQTFAGTVHGNVYYGNTAAYESSTSQGPPAPFSNVPIRQDPDFVDRDDILTQIDKRCSQPAGRAALVGLSGVGKSQLAIEYSYRVRKRSPQTWVFWVRASNAARFEAAYKNIADRLRLLGRNDATANVLQLVHDWLCSEDSGRWLIILDNADDESLFRVQRQEAQSASFDARGGLMLADFLPQSQNGSILITSRNVDIAVKFTGRDKDVIRIQSMSQEQGLKLLQNKLSHPLDGPATELLAALDYMPFAIARAAAYINRRWPRTTIASYTLELHTGDEARKKLLGELTTDLHKDVDASDSVLAPLQISFERIREVRPSAANLLSFMSWFNPQGIPEFLLRHYSDHESGFEDDLDLLRSYLFITTNESGDVFETHRLVQFAIRAWLRSFGEEDKWRRKFLATLSKEFPKGEFNNWSRCQLLLPHVESLASKEPVDTEEAKWWAKILFHAAWYSREQGLYVRAEEMAQYSLQARTRTLGMENSDTLASVDNLASVLQAQGKYLESERMNRHVLGARERMLGREHPSTLASLSNLTNVLWRQGKYVEAQLMSQQALEGQEKVLGKEHPDTLESINILASILRDQGRYLEAEQMYRRALEGRREALEKEHPDALENIENLASVLSLLGKYSEAEQMFRLALEGKAKVLGGEHPRTLMTVHDLAVVLRRQRKHVEAGRLFQRSLEGVQKALGKEHPDTLTAVHDLALWLRDQGRYAEAEQMHRRALEGYEKALGKEHPWTLTAVNNLAEVLRYRGKYAEAEQLNRRALEGKEMALGKEHPATLMAVNSLALALGNQSKYAEAEQMHRRAVEGCEKALGKEHPDTLVSVYNLACFYHQQTQYGAAFELYERACDGYERRLGPGHPTTIKCRGDFAYMVREMDDLKRHAKTKGHRFSWFLKFPHKARP